MMRVKSHVVVAQNAMKNVPVVLGKNALSYSSSFHCRATNVVGHDA